MVSTDASWVVLNTLGVIFDARLLFLVPLYRGIFQKMDNSSLGSPFSHVRHKVIIDKTGDHNWFFHSRVTLVSKVFSLSIIKFLSNDNVVVCDIVDLVNSVDGILVAECRKRIVSLILKFISRKTFYRFKIIGFFLYIPTDWYHPKVGFCRSVSVTEEIMYK